MTSLYEETRLIRHTTAPGDVCTVGPVARARSLGLLLAGLGRVAGRHPRLARWFIGNRARQVSLRGEYALRRDGGSAAPRSISLRATFLCNAHCRMCACANSVDADTGNAVTDRNEFIELDVACRLVDSIAPSCTKLDITGGEPFTWGEDLFTLLDHCRRLGVPTSVTTNGTLVGRHLDRLVQSPPDVLIVSLLGPEETHNEIVGLPAHAAIRDALTALYERKRTDRWQLPLVVTNTVMLAENAHVFSEVARMSHALGACAASFQPLWFATGQMHDAQEDERSACNRRAASTLLRVAPQPTQAERTWREMQRARSVAADLGHIVHFYPDLGRRDLAVYYDSPERLIGRRRALCAYLLSQVFPDGSVMACHGHSVGNLRDQEFPAIWNGSEMRAFRRRLRAVGTFPVCSRCCALWRNE